MQNNVLLGICLMVVTTFMFSAMDGVSRFLAEPNNVFTLVTMRYWFIAMIMIISCLFIKKSLTKYYILYGHINYLHEVSFYQ